MTATDNDDRLVADRVATVGVYFAASISGGRGHALTYHMIGKLIRSCGAEVLSPQVLDPEFHDDGLTDEQIFDRDIGQLRAARGLIADVTQPSLGVGYEIGAAEALGLPILALYEGGHSRLVSPMIVGNAGVRLVAYSAAEPPASAVATFIEALR